MKESRHLLHPELTLEFAVRLLLASYNHSQGNLGVQETLITLVAWQYPRTRLSPSFLNEVENRVLQSIGRLFHVSSLHLVDGNELSSIPAIGHVPINVVQIQNSVRAEIHDMAAIFAGSAAIDRRRKPKLLVSAASAFINLDYQHTIANANGRPNRRYLRSSQTIISHWTDSYFSYVLEHALKGRPTELAEFDTIYRGAGEMYWATLATGNMPALLDAETFWMLTELISEKDWMMPTAGPAGRSFRRMPPEFFICVDML